MSPDTLFDSAEVFWDPELISVCRRIDTTPGQILVRQGDRSTDLFIVVSGRFRVIDDKGNDDFVLAHLEPEDVFGEMSFLDGSPRSATVESEEEGVVHVLSRDAFMNLFATDPLMGARLLNSLGELLAMRLRAADHSLCLLSDDSEARQKYELRRLIREARRSVCSPSQEEEEE
jgi:CRP-like cAMP-binding protein